MSPRILSRLAQRARARGSQERGAVLVVVSIALVALLGMAALAIDLSSFYKAQRQAQSAADAGALAAAYDLPYNPAGAQSDGTNIATANYPGSHAAVAPSADGKTVTVSDSTSSPSFFGTLFGLTNANISASAVAGPTGQVSQGAVFAYDNGGTNCNAGITLNTNNVVITGGIESNGSLVVNTNPKTSLANGTFGGPSGGQCTYTGSSAAWSSQPTYAAPNAYPLDYRNNMPTCTGGSYYYAGTGTWTPPAIPAMTSSSSSIVVCAPNATINITAGVTNSCVPSTTQLSCPGVTYEGLGLTLNATSGAIVSAPYSNGSYGLLFYQSGTDTAPGSMLLSANSSTLNGTIFAPNATIQLSGNASGTGFIEGNAVIFGGNNGSGGGSGNSGNSINIIGDGPPVASTGYTLLQ
jgi:Flp pilus assembly protein TadG